MAQGSHSLVLWPSEEYVGGSLKFQNLSVNIGSPRRSDREAEGARLLSEYAPQGHLGFESLLLRHELL